jgi:hypothetical protein
MKKRLLGKSGLESEISSIFKPGAAAGTRYDASRMAALNL